MVDGRPLLLSGRETALLELLLRRQGWVATRESIEQSVYDFTTTLGSNAVEVLIHRLRRKLMESGATPTIHTVRGVGYIFAPRT
jgi:two-component system response regulator TctD